jgi:hypothetical protein
LRQVDALDAQLRQVLEDVSSMSLDAAREAAEPLLRSEFAVTAAGQDDDWTPPSGLHDTVGDFFASYVRAELAGSEFVLDRTMLAPSAVQPDALVVGHGGTAVEYAATGSGVILQLGLDVPEDEAIFAKHESIFHLIVYEVRMEAQ